MINELADKLRVNLFPKEGKETSFSCSNDMRHGSEFHKASYLVRCIDLDYLPVYPVVNGVLYLLTLECSGGNDLILRFPARIDESCVYRAFDGLDKLLMCWAK